MMNFTESYAVGSRANSSRSNGNHPQTEPHKNLYDKVLFWGLHGERDINRLKRAIESGNHISVHDSRPETINGYVQNFAPAIAVVFLDDEIGTQESTSLLNAVLGAEYNWRSFAGAISKRLELRKPLTERQMIVLNYVRNGCTNKQIAEYMGVKPRTVKEWVKDLCIKFEAAGRVELVARFDEASANLME